MPRNLFRDFALYEKSENPESMVNTVKKQLGVSKKMWVGMPLLISNTKLGKHLIRKPTMFYVSEFDADTVTLTNVLDPTEMGDDDNSEPQDVDGEIDLDSGDMLGKMEVTISKEDFYELQKPQGMSSAGGGFGGGF